MSIRLFSRRIPFAVGVLIASTLGGEAGAQGASLPPSLEIRVPKPPTVGTGENGSFLTYEVHITSFTAQPLTLTKLEVMSAGDQRVLSTLSDSSLVNAVARPGVVNVAGPERLKLAGGTRAVVYMWVPVQGASAPTSIQHRLTVTQGAGDSASTRQLDGPVVPVTPTAVVIGPPLRGGVWLTANGPANGSGHRRALIPVGGTPSIAQRFAIDYVRVGDDEKTFTGDQLKNESYHAEGNDALAVANGTVVAVKDSIPENVPGANSRAVPITLETVGGNHVIIDIGGGYYAFYAHLKPGSLKVKKGDRVTRGQVVGLVGNTGNSTEPHLHFHISDGNSPLGSEGLPYRYDAFEVVGHCRTFNLGCERSAPVTRKSEIPLSSVLIRFP